MTFAEKKQLIKIGIMQSVKVETRSGDLFMKVYDALTIRDIGEVAKLNNHVWCYYNILLGVYKIKDKELNKI